MFTLNDLQEEYKDIFSLHQHDIGHTTLLNMDIETGNHPPNAQKPYIFPLNHTQWIKDEMLGKVGIILESDSHGLALLVSDQRRPSLDKSLRNDTVLTIMH